MSRTDRDVPTSSRARWSTTRPRRAIALIAVAIVLAPLLAVGTLRADVIGEAQVVDGDTIKVEGERIRLQGIDAPESHQLCTVGGVQWPCGQGATRELTTVTAGREVVCKGDKRDRYGRLLAVCYVAGDNVNARMVRDGWALAYRRYATDYVSQEAEARAAGSGIWRGQFVEPWEWRRERRAAR
ncbi:MAG: thermonuclease family protein [Rhodospirillales bacterium]|nr:thermonuclease family protein [Rhodospirillales bacterium]